MADQGLLAKLGLRTGVLGSLASLAIAAPLATGNGDPAAHTAASRIGWYFDRTPGAEKIGTVVMGTEIMSVAVTGVTLTNLTVTGSFTLPVQAAGLVFAGPATGAPATPAFRALALTDLPTGSITGTTAATQVVYGDTTANTIKSSANMTFDGTNLVVAGTITASNASTSPVLIQGGPVGTLIVGSGNTVTGSSTQGPIVLGSANTSYQATARQIVLGYGNNTTNATNLNTLMVGNNNTLPAVASNAIVISSGFTTATPINDSVIIGLPGATVGATSVLIGRSAQAGVGSVAVGNTAVASGANAVAIGQGTTASATNSIAVGQGVSNVTTNTAVWGNSAITDNYFSGTIHLAGSTSGSISFRAPAIAGTPVTLVFPSTNGIAGSALVTDGSGNMSWTTSAGILGSIAATQVAFGSATNTITGSPTFIFAGGVLTLTQNAAAPAALPTGTMLEIQQADGVVGRITIDAYGTGNFASFTGRTARGTAAAPGALQINDEMTHVGAFGRGTTSYSTVPRAYLTMFAAENWTDTAQGTRIGFYTTTPGTLLTTEKFRIWGDGGAQIGGTVVASAGPGSLRLSGPLVIMGATSGAAAINVAAIAGSPATLILPTTSGAATNVLTTDGAGNLSWAAAGGGGGTIGGTIAAPQIAFGSGANTIAGDSTFVYTGTKVGLGTATPAYKLHIHGASSTTQTHALLLTNAGGGDGTGARLGFGYDSLASAVAPAYIASEYVGAEGGTMLRFATGGGGGFPTSDGIVRMTIDGNGLVGINVTYPQYQVDVNGIYRGYINSGGVITETMRLINGGAGEGTGTRIAFGYNTGLGTASPAWIASQYIGAQNGAALQFATGGGGGSVNADGIVRMTIDGNGLVGLGVTAPLAGFHNAIAGAASRPAELLSGAWFTGGSATTTKPMLLVEPTGATSTAWSTAGTGLGVNSAAGFTGNLLDLQTNGVSRVVVQGGGKVGIGVTAPAALLSVTRSAIAGGPGTSAGILRVVGGAHTALDAGVECIGVSFDLSQTKQFNGGAIALQRAVSILPGDYSFTSASTITDANALDIAGPNSGGTNATLTESCGIHVRTRAVTNVTNAYAGNFDAPTGATNNFALRTSGKIKMDGVIYTMPSAQGGASTVLTNDGAGNLSWAAGGGGGGTIGGSITNTQVAFGAVTANTIQGSANFTYDGSVVVLTGALTTGSQNLMALTDTLSGTAAGGNIVNAFSSTMVNSKTAGTAVTLLRGGNFTVNVTGSGSNTSTVATIGSNATISSGATVNLVNGLRIFNSIVAGSTVGTVSGVNTGGSVDTATTVKDFVSTTTVATAVTTFSGFSAQFSLATAATAGSVYGVQIIPSLSGSVITNAYGVYIDDLTAGGAATITNAYGVYQNGSRLTNHFDGLLISTLSPLASKSALLLDGAWFTGGSATTTKPLVLLEPVGTTSTGWSTAGTGLGINAASGFVGRLVDLQLNGASQFAVLYDGTVSVSGLADHQIGANASSWTDAGSLIISDNSFSVLNTNPSLIASFTVTMPSGPINGKIYVIIAGGGVTAFTLTPNAGQTIQGAPTTLAADTSVSFMFYNTVWYRLF